jgi:CubicO group peptidase (beta-lactamase class C family)
MTLCLFKHRLAILIAALTLCSAAHGQLANTVGLPRGDAKAARFEGAKLQAIDALIARAVEQRQIAGGAALVARDGHVVHFAKAGMQDAEAGVPISEATIYRIASMTKPITSVAAMMLIEQGKLKLDDPVAKFIPEFENVRVLRKDVQPNQPLEQSTAATESPITVRQLLNHTSGITYRFWDKPIFGKLLDEAGVIDGLMESSGTAGDNVRRLVRVPLVFQPGSGWEYGLNTDVLGHVIEVASGQSLDAFFRQRIFEPLGMRDTHFVLPADKRSRLAALYTPDESKRIRRVGAGPQQIGATRFSATYPLNDKSEFFSGGAGLVSTLGDYARFLQMLLNRGELSGQRLLKPETVEQMTTNQIGDFSPSIAHHGDKFGFGFGVVSSASPDQAASVGSYSWGGIFHTYFLVDPREKIIAIFATQIYPFDHLTLHSDFKRLVYEARVR